VPIVRLAVPQLPQPAAVGATIPTLTGGREGGKEKEAVRCGRREGGTRNLRRDELKKEKKKGKKGKGGGCVKGPCFCVLRWGNRPAVFLLGKGRKKKKGKKRGRKKEPDPVNSPTAPDVTAGGGLRVLRAVPKKVRREGGRKGGGGRAAKTKPREKPPRRSAQPECRRLKRRKKKKKKRKPSGCCPNFGCLSKTVLTTAVN